MYSGTDPQRIERVTGHTGQNWTGGYRVLLWIGYSTPMDNRTYYDYSGVETNVGRMLAPAWRPPSSLWSPPSLWNTTREQGSELNSITQICERIREFRSPHCPARVVSIASWEATRPVRSIPTTLVSVPEWSCYAILSIGAPCPASRTPCPVLSNVSSYPFDSLWIRSWGF